MSEFISQYGFIILGVIVTAIAGYIGIAIKAIYQKVCNTKIKKELARTCVLAVEQIYQELHGIEKFQKCEEALVELLNEKGIKVSDREIEMLIESAVKTMNETLISIYDDSEEVEFKY